MVTKKSFNCLIALLFLPMTHAQAGESSANMQASAEVSASCFLEVDDLNFGDVSLQTYQGNGDVVASSNFRLLCTKNARVAVKTGEGSNAIPGAGFNASTTVNATSFNRFSVVLETGSTVELYYSDQAGQSSYGQVYNELQAGAGAYTVSGNSYYQISTEDVSADTIYYSASANNTFSAYEDYVDINDVSSGTALYYDGPSGRTAVAGSDLVKVVENQIQDGKIIEDTSGSDVDLAALSTEGLGVTPAQMTMSSNNGANIVYTLSLDSGFTDILDYRTSQLVDYTQNDGQYQSYQFYGKINVARKPVGNYLDTNTMYISF